MRRNKDLDRRLDEAQRQRLCVWGRDASQRRTLARRANAGELQCVYKGMFARPEYWRLLDAAEQYRHIIRSLSSKHPRWVFCEMTAAAFYGFNESTRHMRNVNIAVTRSTYRRDYELMRHHYMSDIQYEVVDGVRVTPLLRTVFDCMRHLEFPDALAIGEAVARKGLASKRVLRDYFQRMLGDGKQGAVKALEYVTGQTENGGEAFSLGVMLEEGFAMPLLQEEVVYPLDLAHRYRVDFSWHTADGRFIVAELDGRVKYRSSSMLHEGDLSATVIAEKEREERIRMIVDDMVRFSFREAMERTLLVRKLERAGVPRLGLSGRQHRLSSCTVVQR